MVLGARICKIKRVLVLVPRGQFSSHTHMGLIARVRGSILASNGPSLPSFFSEFSRGLK